MYLSILVLPLLGSFVSGFLGRKIGVTGAHIITCTCLILSSILASIAFYEVGFCGSPVSINLTSWIDSEFMSISWEFLFDQLTVSMLIPVLYISSLIHIFSTDYMAEDPHNQRFFSYLSLFTFFMLLLVSGANFFVMFIGWEGIYQCLTWNNIDELSLVQGLNIGLTSCKSFSTLSNKKLPSSKRIGPHNIDVLSLIIGSVLGDSHLERRSLAGGTRVIFEQSSANVEYLMWFYKFLAIRGYCNEVAPKLSKRIKKENKVQYHYRINSFTFSSFNWLHEMFYIKVNNSFIKIIPKNIYDWLTPLSLAVWFMDDGSKCRNSARIATNCFTLEEITLLCDVLKQKFFIIATPCKDSKGHIIYIHVKSMKLFSSIVKPYMVPSMYYKLGNH